AGPTVQYPVKRDLSPPLRSIAPLRTAVPAQREDDAPEPSGRTAVVVPDPALQASPGAATVPAARASFEGLSNDDNAAAGAGTWHVPDTNGDVSATQYVEWVNAVFAVYSKTGALLYGPAAGNTLWAGFGGPCETHN